MKGSFSSVGSGKDRCCSICDSDTFSAFDGASECKACDSSANLFSSRGESSCTYYPCGKLCAVQVGVSHDCDTNCLSIDCDLLGIFYGEGAQRDCEDKKSSAACFSRNTRMLLFNAAFNSTLPVSITKSATNPFGPKFIALDVLFLPSDSFPISPTEAREKFLAAAASGTLGGNISAVKIGDTIVIQRGPISKTMSPEQDGSVSTFPLWAAVLLLVSAAAVIIGTALLRNDRALYKKLINLIYKRPLVQSDVIQDEGGPDRRRSVRIDIDALHVTTESNLSSDVGPSTSGIASNQTASAVSQEKYLNVLEASQVQMLHPTPPSGSPVNPRRRIRLKRLELTNSSETTQVETPHDSDCLAQRRLLRYASASRPAMKTDPAATAPSTDMPEILMQTGPMFIRRAAQTPGDSAVPVADTVGAGDLYLDDIDEVDAMVRVVSAGGTVSSQAVFESEQAQVMHAAHEQKKTDKKQKKKMKKQELPNMVLLSDGDVDGVDVEVVAGPMFIRRAAQTPGDSAVPVADTVGAGDLYLDDIDEVDAMVRVVSAGGTVSSQAVFKSEQAQVMHAAHEQKKNGQEADEEARIA
jgi:hypothetical protein